MSTASPKTNGEIVLDERHTEVLVGDYNYRLREASRAKFYGDILHWGGLTIEPIEGGYAVFGIDGKPRTVIDRDDREVEQLAALFTNELEKELNEL
jgi:hypothetical protein